MLTAREAAERLNLPTVRALYSLLARRRDLPRHNPTGGRLYFDEQELEAWRRRRSYPTRVLSIEDRARLFARGARA